MFLTPEEIEQLTGRKVKKLQVEQLRLMAIPFYVNAIGRPVVVRSVLEGKKEQVAIKPRWEPSVLREDKNIKTGK